MRLACAFMVALAGMMAASTSRAAEWSSPRWSGDKLVMRRSAVELTVGITPRPSLKDQAPPAHPPPVPPALRRRARELLERARGPCQDLLEFVATGEHPYPGLRRAVAAALRAGPVAHAPWVDLSLLRYGPSDLSDPAQPEADYVLLPPELRFQMTAHTPDDEGRGRDFRDERGAKYTIELALALGFAPPEVLSGWQNPSDGTAEMRADALVRVPSGASPVRELSALFTYGERARALFAEEASRPLALDRDRRPFYLAFAARVFRAVLEGTRYPDELYEWLDRPEVRKAYGMWDELLALMVLPLSPKQGREELERLALAVRTREQQGPVPALAGWIYLLRKHGW
jgi:hypothetical protein